MAGTTRYLLDGARTSVFVTNHFGIDGGVLVGGGWVNWVWDL